MQTSESKTLCGLLHVAQTVRHLGYYSFFNEVVTMNIICFLFVPWRFLLRFEIYAQFMVIYKIIVQPAVAIFFLSKYTMKLLFYVFRYPFLPKLQPLVAIYLK